LREAWSRAEHVLARRAVDLFQLECVEELVMAAARLGNAHRATPIMDTLRAIVDRLGRPPSWCAALRWIELQAAVALDDSKAVAHAAGWIADQVGFTGRQEALRSLRSVVVARRSRRSCCCVPTRRSSPARPPAVAR
jgi:hypothetical protein